MPPIRGDREQLQEGDKRFQIILGLASEIIARAFENSKSCYPDLSDNELIHRFLALDEEIGSMNLLTSLNATDNEATAKKNMILIFSNDGALEIQSFRDATDALRTLFKLEQEHPEKDVVLVRADTSDEIRVAFRNYFSDAREFIDLVGKGCEKLSGKRAVSAKRIRRAKRGTETP